VEADAISDTLAGSARDAVAAKPEWSSIRNRI
jgi:hypothetical protein